ncbi:hypothetical protein [Actinoplanes derwentensis]|uniref:AMP-binding enzyme C-terminal domain-containing protein n=1 Tax=Actinoplanes derwentensis TaxID=113562 RepID=A0A1H2DEW9_9ACTN|nr:hypothetical protein [Actinoplanes derwentensis]GID84995.1 hypothetical protein Ade03nite_39190 [Actinoplanes derwentensis]SDT81270.1 hypothetical protein SAMN04489716_9564 [Actinoplanes derwentensis]
MGALFIATTMARHGLLTPVFLTELPRNATGKVMARELPRNV